MKTRKDFIKDMKEANDKLEVSINKVGEYVDQLIKVQKQVCPRCNSKHRSLDDAKWKHGIIGKDCDEREED